MNPHELKSQQLMALIERQAGEIQRLNAEFARLHTMLSNRPHSQSPSQRPLPPEEPLKRSQTPPPSAGA
jgi:hypothetical protein